MTKGTFIGMARATPEKFQFSIKVPETITHVKRLDVNKGAITYFEEFLDKISPLRTTNKLGPILFQLPPSFTVNDFKNIEQFLDKLPADGYDYAIEFRHPSRNCSSKVWPILLEIALQYMAADAVAETGIEGVLITL
jgi:uncharacterized protein YecE (DUF72 family)